MLLDATELVLSKGKDIHETICIQIPCVGEQDVVASHE
jgi:hypothetical protein